MMVRFLWYLDPLSPHPHIISFVESCTGSNLLRYVILEGFWICMELYFVWTNYLALDENARRARQNNESSQNIAPYKSNNFLVIYFTTITS